jgi:hypothetical protein
MMDNANAAAEAFADLRRKQPTSGSAGIRMMNKGP